MLKQEQYQKLPTETTDQYNARIQAQTQQTDTGYSSLTQGQKDIVNNVSVVNSGAGKDTIQKIEEGIQPPEQPEKPPKTPVTPPVTPPTPEDQLLQNELDSLKDEATKQAEEAKAEADRKEAEFNTAMEGFKAQLDVNKQNQINNIQSQYSQLRAKQEEANARRVRLQTTIGVRFGGRFVPESTADLVQEQITIGIQKIQELNSMEQTAISTIQNAFDEKSYTLALDEWGKLEKIRKERDDKLAKIEKAQLDGLKKLQEEATQMSITSSIIQLNEEGITDVEDIFNYLKEAGHKITLEDIDKENKILNPDEETVDALAGTETGYKTYKKQIENEEIPTDWTYNDWLRAKGNAKRAPSGIDKNEPWVISTDQGDVDASKFVSTAERELLVNAGIPAGLAADIILTIVSGGELEDIRQAMREQGIDTKILDTFDSIKGGDFIKQLRKKHGLIEDNKSGASGALDDMSTEDFMKMLKGEDNLIEE